MNFKNVASRMLRSVSCIKIDKIVGMNQLRRLVSHDSHANVPGSGAGKGGGAGGAIKESGGGLGKLGAAREESYFYDKQKQQIADMKRWLELNKKSEDAPSEKKK